MGTVMVDFRDVFFLKKGVRVNGLCCAEQRNEKARTLFHIVSSA